MVGRGNHQASIEMMMIMIIATAGWTVTTTVVVAAAAAVVTRIFWPQERCLGFGLTIIGDSCRSRSSPFRIGFFQGLINESYEDSCSQTHGVLIELVHSAIIILKWTFQEGFSIFSIQNVRGQTWRAVHKQSLFLSGNFSNQKNGKFPSANFCAKLAQKRKQTS